MFNYLPLVGSKGEILFIESNELNEEVIIKGPIFIVPLGKNQFWVGATFNRMDKTSNISEEGRNWLIKSDAIIYLIKGSALIQSELQTV